MNLESLSHPETVPVFRPLGKRIKALMVWPKFPGSFWSFAGMMRVLDEKVLMPPLGLITVAALCPKEWTIRLIDQQVEDVSDDDILWADLVMVSGMRVQRKGLEEILARARRLGRRTIMGGPYASGEPEVLLKLADHVVAGEPDEVFSVDDNFIGNHKLALELAVELEKWQQAHGFPLAFYTEASMDLAQRSALIEAMVKANFFYVFVGIESPVKESLTETKKYQNLRLDPIEAIKVLHRSGLWATGGFILGFDSDPEDIFEQQINFIERAAIPWAMVNFLHAVPLTPLHDRMRKE